MLVNVNELLSNRIAKYCEDYLNENGFVSKDSYV